MARLTLPVQADGLIVEVVVSLGRQALTSLSGRGQPFPPSFVGRALIDTGTDVTGISAAVVRHLALTQPTRASTNTAAGLVAVNLHTVALSVVDTQSPNSPMLSVPSPRVMELPAALPAADVLIGLDVLLTCRLFLDGPGGTFSLDF